MKHISECIEPKQKWYKKFAWLPKKSTASGQIIWFRYYWQNDIYMDSWGRLPIKGLYWSRNITQYELLIEKLKDSENQ